MYKFQLEIECESRSDIIDLLEHIKNDIYEGKKKGGEATPCADYKWWTEKKEEDDEH